jgi:hypothetical protein
MATVLVVGTFFASTFSSPSIFEEVGEGRISLGVAVTVAETLRETGKDKDPGAFPVPTVFEDFAATDPSNP